MTAKESFPSGSIDRTITEWFEIYRRLCLVQLGGNPYADARTSGTAESALLLAKHGNQEALCRACEQLARQAELWGIDSAPYHRLTSNFDGATPEVWDDAHALTKRLDSRDNAPPINNPSEGETRTDAAGGESDDDAWVPAASLWRSKSFKTYKKAKAFLDATPAIRTRNPSRYRLEIHAGDWTRYWAKVAEEALDTNAATLTFMDGSQGRYTDLANKKAGK